MGFFEKTLSPVSILSSLPGYSFYIHNFTVFLFGPEKLSLPMTVHGRQPQFSLQCGSLDFSRGICVQTMKLVMSFLFHRLGNGGVRERKCGPARSSGDKTELHSSGPAPRPAMSSLSLT